MSGEKEMFLRLMGQRTASDTADLFERSSSDQVTLVAQALVALAEHLDESAPTWRPIGSATEPLKPGECRSQTPALPRGDDLEEVWHIAALLAGIFPKARWEVGVYQHHHQQYHQQLYIDAARYLIEELDRYRNAGAG